MEINDDHYLSAVLRPGLLSPVELIRALKTFGSAAALFSSPMARLRLIGLSPAKANKAFMAWRSLDPRAEALRLQETSVKTIRVESPGYPPLLRETPDPPPMIFVRGSSEALTNNSNLSVVGSRKMTPYGEAATRKLVAPCARRGITIISGLAFGIDAAAHRAALTANGTTVAVLASGVDHATVGPKANLNLAEEIVESGGCLISEKPPGAPADKRAFPLRNRIIAGLSKTTLIIEAANHSGSLVSARLALELGREVMAVPGSIISPASSGTNRLIADGAVPALEPNDILLTLGLRENPETKPIKPLNQEQEIVLDLISEGPKTVDEILEKSGLIANQALIALTELEDAGFTRQTGEFVILNESQD